MRNSIAIVRSRAGFTLIELMIVIAIIAILAAIVVPSFLHARAEGALSACEENLKTLATAVDAYSADNQGILPLQNGFTSASGVIGTGGLMDTALGPYAQVTGLHCPLGPCSGATQYWYEIDNGTWNVPDQQSYQLSHHGGPTGHGVLGIRNAYFPVWCENKRGSNDGINLSGL